MFLSLFFQTVINQSIFFPGCTEDQYECLDGQCIDSSYQCDSSVDCSRGEDDMGCSGNNSETFSISKLHGFYS